MFEYADWPIFGWSDDIRPMLADAMAIRQCSALATLYRVDGSAPRGPGTQMLFVQQSNSMRARGYFTGDCVESDIARHAAQVLADGQPQHLHYGQGSPWIDIRLQCGGALFVLIERIVPDCAAATALLSAMNQRRVCQWQSDGQSQSLSYRDGALLQIEREPFFLSRRYDPPRRLVITGGDPGALALAKLSMEAGLETILIRPDGPDTSPPFAISQYLRSSVIDALTTLQVDKWTAFIGATHQDESDLLACLNAIRNGAAWVGMIGAKSRVAVRSKALRAAGASDAELAKLHFSPGISGLGKAPWEVATAIFAEIMQVMNSKWDRA